MSKNKIVFMCVDAQKDFINHDGELSVECAEEIKPALKNIIQFALNMDSDSLESSNSCEAVIVYTGDKHNSDSREISDVPNNFNTFLPHCMEHTDGANFIEEVEPFNPIVVDWQDEDLEIGAIPFANEIVIYKDDFDVFYGNKHTEKVFELIKPTMVFVFGVATNICVNDAIIGLHKRGYEVCVVIDAVMEVLAVPMDGIIEKWKSCGIKYVATIPYISENHHSFKFYKKICKIYNHDSANQSHILTIDKFIRNRFGD